MTFTTESLIEALDTLGNIEQVSGLNAKQEYLNSVDNPVLKCILYLTYNNFNQYYIKKIPKFTPLSDESDISHFFGFVECLSKLKTREVTGNAALDLLVETLENCSEVEADWFSRVVRRDLKCGLADKGINKAYPGLVPVYDTMLANKIEQADLNLDTAVAKKRLPKNFVVQYKIDGYRINIHIENDGHLYLTTRNGKLVEGYTELEKEASKRLPKGYVYDGEMVSIQLFDWIQSNMKNDTTIPNRDLFSEAISHAFSHEKNKKGVFNLYDMVPIEEFNNQSSSQTLQERYENIDNMVPTDLDTISVVPTSRVYDRDNEEDMKEVVELFHDFLKVGWEGAMLKDVSKTYTFGRSDSMIKMKLMDTVDLIVTDIYEGDKHSKYEGQMGGVYCDYKGFRLGVGSGWSDEERLHYWKHPNDIIGKTIEVAYQAETSNKQGGLSLSFPVKKKVREDK